MAEEARLYPMRHAYQFAPWGVAQDGSAGLATLGGNYTTPNPPFGATISYSVGANLPNDVRLVANVLDNNGNQVRRLELNKTAGFHRTVWNLRGEAAAGAGGGGRGGGAGAAGRGGGAGAAGAAGGQAGAAGAQGRAGAPPAVPPQGPPAGFGRGGGAGGPAAEPGRYRVVIGKLVGETFTPIGQPQFFQVIELPKQNYILYR